MDVGGAGNHDKMGLGKTIQTRCLIPMWLRMELISPTGRESQTGHIAGDSIYDLQKQLQKPKAYNACMGIKITWLGWYTESASDAKGDNPDPN